MRHANPGSIVPAAPAARPRHASASSQSPRSWCASPSRRSSAASRWAAGIASPASTTASTDALAQQRRAVLGEQPAVAASSPIARHERSASAGSPCAAYQPAARACSSRRSSSASGSDASATSRISPVGANQPSSDPWLSANSPRRASEPSASGAPSTPSAAHSPGWTRSRRRGHADQLAHAGRLLREHLARQVAEQRPAGPAQALDRRAALRRGQRAHRLAGQAHGRGPALGHRMQRGAELARVAVELGLEHRAHLVGVEGEVGAAELEDLALTAQAVDRERRLGARGEHDVQGLGRLAAERLDRAHRGAAGRQRVEVVEDERQRPAQALLQRLGQRGGEGVGARALVGAGVGTARGAGRRREIDGQVGHAQAQRVDQAAAERRERRVLGPERVPGDVVALGPGREQRRLAEAGARDHGGQAAAAGRRPGAPAARRAAAPRARPVRAGSSSSASSCLVHSIRPPTRRRRGLLRARARYALVQPRADATQLGPQTLARRRIEGQREVQLGGAQRPRQVADAFGALCDAIEDPGRHLVATLPRHRRLERASVAQGAARRIDQHRLGELEVGQEGAVGAGDDAHRQSGPPRRLGARDREHQRMTRSSGHHAVEQQVVDPAGQHHGLEARRGQLGQRVQLAGRDVVADADEPRGELVERRARRGRVALARTRPPARGRGRHGVEHPRPA